MSFLFINKLPRQVYHAFIKDGRRLYGLLPRRLRFGFWRIFAVQFLSAFTETLTLLVISLFAVSVAAPDAALNNFIFRAVLGLVPPLKAYASDHRHLVILSSLLMTFFIFFKVSLAALVTRVSGTFAETVSLYIGRETLWRYLNKSYIWHLTGESRDVIHKFSQRAQLSQYLLALLQLYSNVLCCLVLFGSLFMAQPALTLLLIMTFGSASLGTYLLLRRRLDAAGEEASRLGQAESADHLAMTQGLREVFLYHRQEVFFQKLSATMARGRPVRAALTFYGQLPSQVLELTGFSTISLMTIGMLAWGIPMPAIVSSVSMLMLTAWRVLPAVSRAMNYLVTIRSLRPAALVCLELLERFIKEAPDPLPAPNPGFRFRRDLEMRNLSFAYPGARQAVLHNLHLKISRGEHIGLVGPSGAGKSTLALLLTGLVPPGSGLFLVDGAELEPADRAAYVRLIGFVPQSPLLLPGTVADNVAFSRWGEEYDHRKLDEVCRLAAMDFVFEHPQGLNRSIGGGGGGLSGGEAQRAAIARALFAGPEIIIFDEATSALDHGSENIIAATISRLAEKTTVIIIAHRLSTVENCDRLIWLEKGRIRATGPPLEILPLYKASMAENNGKDS